MGGPVLFISRVDSLCRNKRNSDNGGGSGVCNLVFLDLYVLVMPYHYYREKLVTPKKSSRQPSSSNIAIT